MRITDLAGVYSFRLSASSAGRRLAAVILKRQRDVYVGELREGVVTMASLRRLTLDDRDDRVSDWTPDAAAVVFASNRRGNWDIYKQGVNARMAEPIVDGPANETDPVLYGDANTLLYKSRSAGPDGSPSAVYLMRMPLAGGPTHQVMELHGGTVSFRCPRQSGADCVLGEALEGELVLTAFDPSLGRGRELARMPVSEMTIGNPGVGWDVSPDGTRIAVPFLHGIRIFPVTGGASVDIPVLESDMPFTLGWAVDGKTLFVSTKRPDGLALLRVDETGRSQTLWSVGTLYTLPRPSPDGRYLALEKFNYEADAWLLENF